MEHTPLKRACSELLYGPACQKGFTSPSRRRSYKAMRLTVFDAEIVALSFCCVFLLGLKWMGMD